MNLICETYHLLMAVPSYKGRYNGSNLEKDKNGSTFYFIHIITYIKYIYIYIYLYFIHIITYIKYIYILSYMVTFANYVVKDESLQVLILISM